MKQGGNLTTEISGSVAMQISIVVLPLFFALWAAFFTGQAELPLIFAAIWGLVCFVYLKFFAHIRRSSIKTLNQSRQEALMQHNRTLAIINNLADAIIATDETGNVTLSNAASLSLLDTNTALTGKKIDSVLRLFDTSGQKLSPKKLLSEAKTAVAREDVDLKVGDETLHISLIYAPIKGTDSLGEYAQKGYVIIVRDITRQKSLEEERDEFISVVSHELRTPITIAEGALSNLQLMNERTRVTTNQLMTGISMAHEQILFLAGMINDLSTLSRAERGVMSDKTLIDVRSLIHAIYSQNSKEAHKKRLQFNLDIDPHIGKVEASELYLQELIQNFVTNAIKYTKKGSVTLRAHKKDGMVEFSVKDTGIGISKSDQKRIYEKFFRSEDYRTRETSGTGLGLYVAQKLSNLLGTKIRLESRLNHGSTFSFELPQAED